MISEEEIKKMIEVATQVRENAFAFKSGHGFGACVLTEKGNIYEGCNVEGVISSLGVCAEMAALDHAVAHGEYKFKALAVVDEKITWPCGACLQYLTQFYQVGEEDIEVIAANIQGEWKIEKLSNLLPQKYESKSMEEVF